MKGQNIEPLESQVLIKKTNCRKTKLREKSQNALPHIRAQYYQRDFELQLKPNIG